MPPSAAAAGGGVYGQGVHGRTIDVVPKIMSKKSRPDPDTMVSALLSASRSPAWISYVFVSMKRDRKSKKKEASEEVGGEVGLALRKKRMTNSEMDALMTALATEPEFREMVAKEMRETSAFEDELRMNDRVLRAYGDKDSKAFTTLRVVNFAGRLLVGIRIPSSGLHYTLQSRCQTPLDRFKFKEHSDVRMFVRDIMASFNRLHSAGYLHADVKRDNMILCSGSGTRKFRLIDWGASTSTDRIRKGYLGSSYVRPKNSISPLAWFVYGAEPVAQWITLGRAATLHSHAFATSPTFRQFASDAISASREKIDKLIEETGEETSVEQPKARRLAFDRHWRAFDLFNMGFILAEIACTTRGGKTAKEHDRLMRLAYKCVNM